MLQRSVVYQILAFPSSHRLAGFTKFRCLLSSVFSRQDGGSPYGTPPSWRRTGRTGVLPVPALMRILWYTKRHETPVIRDSSCCAGRVPGGGRSREPLRGRRSVRRQETARQVARHAHGQSRRHDRLRFPPRLRRRGGQGAPHQPPLPDQGIPRTRLRPRRRVVGRARQARDARVASVGPARRPIRSPPSGVTTSAAPASRTDSRSCT